MSLQTRGRLLSILGVTVVGSLTTAASANERRFTYTYESAVLNPGDAEIEPWTTFRLGREDYYSRMDNRLEFEVGVVEGLQTAWYFNWSSRTQDTDGVRASESTFKSVSSEWKLKLTDPVADALGSAFYVEGSLGPAEAELEAKLIFDKRVGDVIIAANLVGEHEWEFEQDETEREIGAEAVFGLAWMASERMSFGLEVRNANEIKPDDGWENSALYAGPVFGFASEKWWTTFTVLPQVLKLKGEEEDEGRSLVLSGRERLEARILFGFHL